MGRHTCVKFKCNFYEYDIPHGTIQPLHDHHKFLDKTKKFGTHTNTLHYTLHARIYKSTNTIYITFT